MSLVDLVFEDHTSTFGPYPYILEKSVQIDFVKKPTRTVILVLNSNPGGGSTR
jgi:hypothetical protein